MGLTCRHLHRWKVDGDWRCFTCDTPVDITAELAAIDAYMASR